ncbi:MOSC domain-containing protein [Paenarthrobacter sp. Z7-10]|uniref:MOSC domain-containing protein n=1 Tax=Paenarthrobacter sp. Z7-10 TaxID=2787635 RepID=UPI0022A9BB88|nr:MOSC domain-containing protein [Paenarthrobacter sp. Z7-10]MCZ2402150.1 MOSC domain-containing protein [Paenarthrobacter sp. Z7-10]
MSAELLAVCRVHALLPDASTVGVTAIDKRAVTGPVPVHVLGLGADIQADRRNHGGEDQALYAYSQEDADYWSAELGQDIPPGRFGENLRTAGVQTTGAVIGERWQIGSTVVVEVTSPRVPCATFQRRMQQPRWVKRFTDAARVGTYLRVLVKGSIEAGNDITVLHRPSHGITVGGYFSRQAPEDVRSLTRLHEAGELRLAEAYWANFDRILRREA